LTEEAEPDALVDCQQDRTRQPLNRQTGQPTGAEPRQRRELLEQVVGICADQGEQHGRTHLWLADVIATG